MKIVQRQDDQGGVEMRLAVVEKSGRLFVYFLPPGVDKAQRDTPHFVIASGSLYGELVPHVEFFDGAIAEFVCPDFAGSEDLKRLRTEVEELRRRMVSDQELEALRADRAELEILRAKQREIAELKTRLAELEAPPDTRRGQRPKAA